MKLPIVQAGEEVLRKAARELSLGELASDPMQRFIEQMQETMREAPGVGLAAPQVGVSVQLAVIEDRPEYTRELSESSVRARVRIPVPFHVIVNPKITLHGPEVD